MMYLYMYLYFMLIKLFTEHCPQAAVVRSLCSCHRCLRTGPPPPHSPDIKPRAYPDYFHKLSFYNIFVI